MEPIRLFTAKPKTLLAFWVSKEDLENFKKEIASTGRINLFGNSYEAFVGSANDYPVNMNSVYCTIRYKDIVYFHVYSGHFLTIDNEGTLKCYTRKWLDIHYDEKMQSQKLLIDFNNSLNRNEDGKNTEK
jgi:hypothetical protein